MARWKITFGFRVGAIGGSESYISPDQDGATLSNTVQDLIAKRAAMQHTSVAWDGMRFALLDPLQKRRSQFYPPGTWPVFGKPADDGSGGIFLIIPPSGGATAANMLPDQARSALLTRVTFDVDRTAPHYLYAAPDAVIAAEPASYNPGGSATFVNALVAFRAQLLSKGWSVRARRRDTGFTPLPIKGWRSSGADPSVIGAITGGGGSAPYEQGDVIQILNTRRTGTDRTTYNGKYIVDSVAAGPATGQFTTFLRGTEAGVPSSIKRLGSIQKIGYDYYPIKEFQPIKASTHKRGRPFGQPRGNKQKRVSLDF